MPEMMTKDQRLERIAKGNAALDEQRAAFDAHVDRRNANRATEEIEIEDGPQTVVKEK